MIALLLLLACGPDKLPPAVAVPGDGDLVSGPLRLYAADPSGLAEVVVTVDGVVVDLGPDLVLDTTTLADGPHTAEIVAVDASDRRNRARASASFVTENHPPVVRVAGAPLHVRQGYTLAVWVEADEPLVDPMITFLGREEKAWPMGERVWRALYGVGSQEPPGAQPLELRVRDTFGKEATYVADVVIDDVEWPEGGYIRLRGRRSRKKAPVVVEPDEDPPPSDLRRERDAAYSHRTAMVAWGAPLSMPAEGKLTSPYGKERKYSDGSTRIHSGMDIQNKRGTPVVAAADGIVVLAWKQQIFGNVVMLDHGHGVVTSYNHLDRIDVIVGDQVGRGTQIGRVGNTGQSTGPHLHWGLTVAGFAVDPAEWLSEDFSAPTGDWTEIVPRSP